MARLRRVLPILALVAGCATAPPPKPDLVWPLPPEAPRIRYVESIADSEHFKPKGASWVKDAVLGADQGGQRMGKPFAVTADDKGRIYVTDTGMSLVWVFDPEKKQVRFLGDSGQGRLVTPSGVVVDERGVVFVSDTRLDRVFGYDQSGQVVMEIGKAGEFGSPAGLAIDRPGKRLYVADAGQHKIRVYDAESGAFRFEFGKRGIEPGEFNFPTHLFVRNDRLFVADTMNFRVQQFTLEGTYLGKLGEMGAQLGQLARPKGIAVDSDGHIYVADAAFGNFQIFDGSGEHSLLLFVGQTGTEPGQFTLPAGMFIDARDRVYVADQYNRRVQVFQYVKPGEVAGSTQDRAGTGRGETAKGGGQGGR